MAVLTLLLLVVLSVEPMGFDQPHLKESVLLLLAPLLLWRSAWSGRLNKAAAAPLSGPARWLGLWLAVTLLAALLISENRLEGLRTFAVLLALTLVLLDVSVWSYERPLRLPLGLLLAGLVTGSLALSQKLGWDFPFGDFGDSNAAVSLFGNTNLTGEFLAPLIPLALLSIPVLAGWKRWFAAAALAASLGGLLSSGSRGALLALGAGLLAAAWFSRGRREHSLFGGDRLAALALGLALALLTGGPEILRFKALEDSEPSITSPEYASTRQRLLLAEATFEMVRAKPWLGHGPGSFRGGFPPYRDPREAALPTLGGAGSEAEDPHNQFLLILAEGGVLALALALLFLLPAVFAFRSSIILPAGDPRRQIAPGLGAALVTHLTLWLFRSPLEHAPSALSLFLVTGALLPYREDVSRSAGVRPDGLAARILPAYLLGLLALGVAATGADLLLARSARAIANQIETGHRSYALHAERCLDWAAALDPSNFYVLQARAEALRILSRKGEDGLLKRQRAYQAMLDRFPWNRQALIGSAALLLNDGRPEQAQKHLRRLARLRPRAEQDDVEFLVRVGQPEAAARQLLYRARHAPVPTAQLRDRAEQAERDGQRELAIACQQAILDLHPYDGDAAFKLGELFAALERLESSRRMYSRAQVAFALEHLGQRNYEGALRAARISMRHRPSVEAEVLIALARLGEGDDGPRQELLERLGRLERPLDDPFLQALRRLEGNAVLTDTIRALAD